MQESARAMIASGHHHSARVVWVEYNEQSLESGLKYLIIGSVGSATLLYGLALLYGATGSTDYAGIAERLNAEGYRTAKGLRFDMYSVGYVARSRGWGRSAAKRTEADV